jgi:hypothetical protein
LNAFFHLPVSCKFALWFLWAFMPGSLPRYYFIYVVLFLWAEHTAESRCRIRQHTLVEINLLLLHNTTVCIMLKLWLWVWIIINWWKWIILYRCKIRLLNANVETTEFYQHIDSLSCNSDEVLADDQHLPAMCDERRRAAPWTSSFGPPPSAAAALHIPRSSKIRKVIARLVQAVLFTFYAPVVQFKSLRMPHQKEIAIFSHLWLLVFFTISLV